MSARKRVLLIAGALALVLLLVFAFRPQPATVETVVVERGPLLATIGAEGRPWYGGAQVTTRATPATLAVGPRPAMHSE